MRHFIVIVVLFLGCASGEQINTHNAPPAPTSPPVAENEFAQPPAGQPNEASLADPATTHRNAKKSAALNESGSMGDALGGGSEAMHRMSSDSASASAPPRAMEAEPSKQMYPPPSMRGNGAVARTPQPPQPPLDRPGLATSWGEMRYSRVDEVAFERDSTVPNCQGSMWYNDRRGAEAAGRNTAWSDARLPIGCGVSLELHDDNGNALSAVRSAGRVYAVGESNQRYTITVRNNSNARFEMVVSVDGLDVLDGHAAGFGKRGYLVPAHGAIDIDGFRRSGSEVAAFRFGAVSDSYAARTTGSARNVGVIGVAAFAERGYVPAYSWRELERRHEADPFPNRYAPPPPSYPQPQIAHRDMD